MLKLNHKLGQISYEYFGEMSFRSEKCPPTIEDKNISENFFLLEPFWETVRYQFILTRYLIYFNNNHIILNNDRSLTSFIHEKTQI